MGVGYGDDFVGPLTMSRPTLAVGEKRTIGSK